MSKGWIKLHRRIKDHWLYPEGREFTDYEAWQDILLSVNHKKRKVRIKNRVLTCERGQSLRSTKGWAKRWNWSKSKAYRFFSLLENEGMIETESETVTTRLTVCNYSTYQSNRNANETHLERRRNGSETTPDTNNNEKNVKNEKKYTIGDSEKWDEEQPISHTSFVDKFNKLYDKQLRVTGKKREMIRARLRTFTGKEILKAWNNRKKDDWLNGEGKEYLGDWKAAMRNDEKVDRYLHKQNGQTGLGDNSKFRKI